jgi:hypothetical protein
MVPGPLFADPDQSELGVGSVATGTFGCPPTFVVRWKGVSRSAVSPSIRHFELGATTLAAPCSALPWRAAGPGHR